MPNLPTPSERKRRTGNPGKRALPSLADVVALPAATEPPEPLRPLGAEGHRMWNRLWSIAQVWVSPASDIELVQLLCEAMDERVALRKVVLAGADWRDRVALRNLESSITSILGSLGLTPVDRTRMGVAEVRRESKLDQLRARRSE